MHNPGIRLSTTTTAPLPICGFTGATLATSTVMARWQGNHSSRRTARTISSEVSSREVVSLRFLSWGFFCFLYRGLRVEVSQIQKNAMLFLTFLFFSLKKYYAFLTPSLYSRVEHSQGNYLIRQQQRHNEGRFHRLEFVPVF